MESLIIKSLPVQYTDRMTKMFFSILIFKNNNFFCIAIVRQFDNKQND